MVFRICRRPPGWAGGALIVLVLLLLPALVQSQERLGPLEDLEEYLERAAPQAPTGMSIAPILAYEPTLGTLFGGAAFLQRPYDPHFRLFSRAAFSTRGEYSVLANYRRWYGWAKFFHLEVEIDDFSRPYYGEGMDTSADDRIMLDGTTGRLFYWFNIEKRGAMSTGPFIDLRATDRQGVDGTEVPPPDFDEATLAVGYLVNYDSRDSVLSPTDGMFNTVTLRLAPSPLSTAGGDRTFFQAEVDHRGFASLGCGVAFAGRIYAGGSWGAPDYHFRYNLGGPYLLRGFFANRFRGDKFYSVQGELRKHLCWIGSGAVFAEIGEASDGWFDSPEVSAGAGLRFTLPPDHVAKARLDFAWSKDQQSIYFIFGEAF
ncbi:MAG: BamA/TamA family outer membrane protein [Proteobacteria bacterium]|nr:BamA/TamA family outer membrane protein [Pseudomonadota bacterium]